MWTHSTFIARYSLIALIGAFLFTGLSATASAAVVRITWSGIVTAGSDSTGVFGTVAANLAGDHFSSVFTFNTDLGQGESAGPGGGGSDSGPAGTCQNSSCQSPLIESVLTINDHVATIFYPAYGIIYGGCGAYYCEFATTAADSSGTPSFPYTLDYVSLSVSAGIGLPPSIMSNFAYAIPNVSAIPGGSGSGEFEFLSCSTSNCFAPTIINHNAWGNLDPTKVTESVLASGVPEPATWAMTLFGFAGLGWAAYRRASSKGNAARALA